MEYDVDEVPWRQQLITRPLQITDGELKLPEGAGGGADVDERLLVPIRRVTKKAIPNPAEHCGKVLSGKWRRK
jgi:hypothetical protein